MKYLKLILTVIVLSSFGLFICVTDFNLVISQIEKVGDRFYIILLISLCSFLLGSMAWKYCFIQHSKVSLFQLFYVRTIGEIISFINPTNIIAGEASKVQLMNNIDITDIEKIDAVLISRIVLISTQLSLAILCTFWIGYTYNYILQVLLFWCVVISLCILCFMACRQLSTSLSQYIDSSFSKKLIYLQLQCKRFFYRFLVFSKRYTNQLVIAIGVTSFHWFVGAFELFYILSLLDIDSTILNTLTVDMGIIILKSMAGFIPGQIGVEELGNKYLLQMIGIQAVGIWVSVSVIRRARQVCWILISAVMYFFHVINIKKYLRWQFFL